MNKFENSGDEIDCTSTPYHLMEKMSLEKNTWLELEREVLHTLGILLPNGLDRQDHSSTLGWTYSGEKLVRIAWDSTMLGQKILSSLITPTSLSFCKGTAMDC